jgi:peptidoglycan glycosyltransferase
LEENINPILDCPAEGYQPPETDRWIRDHEYHEARRNGRQFSGYMNMGLQEALIRSSNVYFSQLGVILGASRMIKYLSNTGFDREFSLGNHLLFHDSLTVKKSRVSISENTSPAFIALSAMGQGKVSVRPMHMAILYSIVANDGVLQKPRLLPNVPQGLLELSLSSNTCGFLREACYQVVERGTGRSLRIPGLKICGKTGTADNPHGAPHSWFISFAPKDSPTFLVSVIIENAGFGSGAAAKLSRKIYEQAVELNYLKLELGIVPKPVPEQDITFRETDRGDQ